MAKTNNVFINFVSEKLLHQNTTRDGKTFVNVSFPCEQSTTGYGSFGVNMGQVLAATRKDKTVVDGYKSILLGKPDAERQVSIATAAGTYENVKMTNQAIVDSIEASRKAYREAQATAAANA